MTTEKTNEVPASTGGCSLEPLVSELKSQCNRYVNGRCMTHACLKRGGYKPGTPADYSIATCERYEQVQALEALLANAAGELPTPAEKQETPKCQ